MKINKISNRKNKHVQLQNPGSLICGIIVIFFLAGILRGGVVSRVGTSAATFLKIGVGARGLAMGEAQVTQVNDVTALFWNPGVLGNLDRTQLILNHYDYIADINYEYGGFVMPLPGIGTFGAFISYLGMSDIERTTELFPEGTGETASASSYAVGISYGRNLTDRFSVGGSMKMVNERIWHCSSRGFAADIGLIYISMFRNIKIGMSISNFGTPMKMEGRDLLIQHDVDTEIAGNNSNINGHLDTDEFHMPIFFRVGISANLAEDFLGMDNHDLIIALDALHPNDNHEYLNVGAEYVFRDMIALRTGYRKLFLDLSEGGPSFGGGLKMNLMGHYLQLDYAAIDFGRFDYLNKFSIIFTL